MRVAVISDIHANLHALEAVLGEIDREQPDELWCLGDLVGYGPRPNECCRLVQERADLCLVGNHDLVALGTLGIEDFNPEAAEAARWTANALDDESRSFLASLPPSAAPEHAQLFHASARDPIWEYVLTDEAATATLLLTTAPARPRRAQPRRARGHARRPDSSRAGSPRGGTTKELEGRVAPQPRLGRPAARRRPERRLAPARFRGEVCLVSPRRIPHLGNAEGAARGGAARGARIAARRGSMNERGASWQN